MKLVIVESPYAGNVQANIEYARRCIRDSILRDEAPIASHLLYTQPGILDDNVPDERALGILAGLEWYRAADLIVFYMDRGMSNGMNAAYEYAGRRNIGACYRWLDPVAREEPILWTPPHRSVG